MAALLLRQRSARGLWRWRCPCKGVRASRWSQGEIVAVLGRNGVGKSLHATMKALIGLLALRAGARSF